MTRLCIAPIGYLADGKPYYAYFGSENPDDGNGDGEAGENNEDSANSDGDSGDNDSIGEDGLNESGRKAIQAERSRADRAKNALKPWAAIRREFGMTAEQVAEVLRNRNSSNGSDNQNAQQQEVDVDQIKRDAARQAAASYNMKIASLALRAIATPLLNNPADATAFLDASQYDVDEEGNVDEAEIKADIQALLRDRPYLAKARQGDGRSGGDPDFDGGTRQSSSIGSMDDFIRRAAHTRR